MLKNVAIGVGILFLASFAACYVALLFCLSTAALHSLFPAWLAGVADKEKYIHDWFELGYFAVNVVVPPLAVFALVFTYRQLVGAEHARLASIYIEMSAGWNSDRLVESRMYLLGLRDKFRQTTYTDQLKQESQTEQEYIKKALQQTRQTDRLAHSKNTAILTYLEDLGVLCKKRYVLEGDVFDLIASPIVVQTDLLMDYIRSFTGTNYEHTLLLYDHARKYLDARHRRRG